MVTLQDYCAGLIFFLLIFFYFLSGFFTWRPLGVQRILSQDNFCFASTYRLYSKSFIYLIQLDFFVEYYRHNSPVENVLGLLYVSLVENCFWCSPRFEATRGWFLLVARLFLVIFMRCNWTFDGYYVLDCCVICTLPFSFFHPKRKHKSYLARNYWSQP